MRTDVNGRPNEPPRYTTITWEEYLRLQRDARILDWLEADFARADGERKEMSLREMIGGLLDAGADATMGLGQAVRRLTRRPAAPPAAEDPSRLLGPW